MMTNELLKLVKCYLDEGYFDTRVRDILNHTEYTSEEIDYLWSFTHKIQKELIHKHRTTVPIKKMKLTIGTLIGSKLSVGNMMTKDDIYRVYTFITSLPKEYLKDKK